MDGIVLIDKPAGMGSAEVVRRVKRLVKPAKVGHLGTLDPFATGLLPILIGEATKIAQFLEHHEKHYEGVIALGAQTDTLDPAGEVIATAPVPQFGRAELEEAARRFIGEFEQEPPVYSAIKRAGVPMYKLARTGAEIPPPQPRVVHVMELRLCADTGSRIRFALRCATGMYVRALARDIGMALGTVAHLAELRRVGTAGFSISQATALEQALSVLERGDGAALIGLAEALAEMPEVEIDTETARRVRNGDAAALLGVVKMVAGPIKMTCGGHLVAIAQFGPDGQLALMRVFAG